MPRKKLGESLRERGKISKQILEKAIQEQAGTAVLLGELLLERGLVAKADLIASLEEVTRAPYVDAAAVVASDEILQLIPGRIARRYCALPLASERGKLVVVMEKPPRSACASGVDVCLRTPHRRQVRLPRCNAR